MASVKRGSFYVTCTSSKSRDYFPDNKTSSFTTRLPEPIYLDNADRRWEVGVSSFTYSQAINNFGEGSLIEFFLYDGYRIHQIKVPDQHVTNVNEVVNAMNDAIISYADLWNEHVLANDKKSMLFQRAQNNRHRSSRVTHSDKVRRDGQTSLKHQNSLKRSSSPLPYDDDSEENRVKRSSGNSAISLTSIAVSPTLNQLHESHEGDPVNSVQSQTREKVTLVAETPSNDEKSDVDGEMNMDNDMDDDYNEDDDDDDDENDESDVKKNESKAANARKRISLMENISKIRFSSRNMYGIPKFTQLTEVVFEDISNEYRYGVVVEAAFIRFYVSDGKIDLSLGLPHYDLAFSPNLLKMLGFQDYHTRFSLERMKKRILLRECLFGIMLNDMNKLKILKAAVGEEKTKKGIDLFSEKGAVYRHQFYERNGFSVGRFNAILHQKSKTKGYNSIADMMKQEFVSEKEYVKLIQTVFHNDSFSFMDYAVYTLMMECPFDSIIYGSRYTTLLPTDIAFVYTNIIEPEVVDDKQMRLLEIMPIRSVADGKVDLIEFSNTHYKTLDVDTLSDIKILIATAYGTPVPFRYGPATVQLHFRRRRA
jgi:hypothetical protein